LGVQQKANGFTPGATSGFNGNIPCSIKKIINRRVFFCTESWLFQAEEPPNKSIATKNTGVAKRKWVDQKRVGIPSIW